ncbi:MAG: glycosyltransferase family 4 protein [Planctomycetia bacterium]|nr:glycosyltransferase family 4 protein [Planctomycetia bacterium]
MPAFPKLSETFLVNKFVGLLRQGVDAYVVCGRSDESEWRNYPHFAEQAPLRRRIVRSWAHEPRWLAALLWPFALLYTFVMRPSGTVRYFRFTAKSLGVRCLSTFYLDAALIRLQPDIVHFEFGTLVLGRTHLRDALPAKLVVSFRGFDLNYSGLDDPQYYQQAWQSLAGVHCLGQDLWRRAQRRGCPPSMPHVLIPPAIDVERFSGEERPDRDVTFSPERPFRILCVGRLHWKKGHEYALLAVSELRKLGVPCELRVVGDGEALESLYLAIHELELVGVVTLVGSMPHEQVRQELDWADVLLHAAVSEGFCNSVLEAQAMAKPVVCSDADGLSENVRDGVTGFVTPRRDIHAMAEKLALLAGNAELRRDMGAAGRQRVLRQYRLEAQIDAFARWYDELLGESSDNERADAATLRSESSTQDALARA